jgi:hypothetical protein
MKLLCDGGAMEANTGYRITCVMVSCKLLQRYQTRFISSSPPATICLPSRGAHTVASTVYMLASGRSHTSTANAEAQAQQVTSAFMLHRYSSIQPGVVVLVRVTQSSLMGHIIRACSHLSHSLFTQTQTCGLHDCLHRFNKSHSKLMLANCQHSRVTLLNGLPHQGPSI